MFNFRPNLQRLGFHVEPPAEEDVPGLHTWRSKEEVPGFDMNADGSGRQTARPAAQPRTDVSGNPFGLFDLYGASHDAFTPVDDGSTPPYLGRWPIGSVLTPGTAPAGVMSSGEGPSSQSPYTLLSHTAGPNPPSSPNLPPPPFVPARNAWPAADRADDPNIVRAADIQVAQNQPLPSRTSPDISKERGASES